MVMDMYVYTAKSTVYTAVMCKKEKCIAKKLNLSKTISIHYLDIALKQGK